jgi:hypothetical protein
MPDSDPHEFVNARTQIYLSARAYSMCGAATGPSWSCSACVCAAHKLKTCYGEMQSPLETSVQALRNTRPVEEVCAWTT